MEIVQHRQTVRRMSAMLFLFIINFCVQSFSVFLDITFATSQAYEGKEHPNTDALFTYLNMLVYKVFLIKCYLKAIVTKGFGIEVHKDLLI